MLIRIDEETAEKVEKVRRRQGHRSATATIKSLIDDAEKAGQWIDETAARIVAPKRKRGKVA